MIITMKNRQPKLIKFFIISLCASFIHACALNPNNAIDKLTTTLKSADKKYQEGHLDSAAELYQEVLQLDEYQPSVYYRLGNIAFKQNKLLEAQNWYIKALQSKPHYIEAHHNLSIVYLSLAKPHMDYFNNNANKNQADKTLKAIAELISNYTQGK